MSISQIPSGWTITRSDERIVVQHVSGSFYAAAKEGDGIAESILYMLADSLLSATLSPAHIEDGEEVEGVRAEVAYSAPPAAGVPEGWKLVPIEPTADMQAAGATAIRFETTLINKLFTGNAVYRAAISAAPTPPASEQQRAVVMPERKRSWYCMGEKPMSAEDEAYNACLDEFLRLNPHLATPPQENDR